MRKLLTILCAVFCLLFRGQAQPVYRFSVKVGIDAESVDSLGGIGKVTPMVKKMFADINYAFNHTRRFDAVYDFDVDWDALYIYKGISLDEVFKPHPDHDYLVVIDGFKSDPRETGGGWYGDDVQAIYHARTHNDRFNNPFDKGATDGIIHEFGHARGVPDIYAMIVDAGRNPVAGIGCNTTRCIMDYPYGETFWSDYAVNMINASGSSIVEIDDLVAACCPDRIDVTVTGLDGKPAAGAEVTLYPVPWYSGRVDYKSIGKYKVPENGVLSLPGDVYQRSSEYGLKYPNLFVDACKDGNHAYGWLPLYEVQNAYFKGLESYGLDLVIREVKPSPAPKEQEQRWKISPDGGIEWTVADGSSAHYDHIEMSGEKMSAVLRWGVDANGAFSLERSLVFPMLRTIPNDTHASLMHRVAADIPSMISVGGLSLRNQKVSKVSINGALKVESTWSVGKNNIGGGHGIAPKPALKMTQTVFPSENTAALYEIYSLENISGRTLTVYVPDYSFSMRTLAEKSVYGPYDIYGKIASGSGTFVLANGEKLTFTAQFGAVKEGQSDSSLDAAAELAGRMAFVSRVADESLILHTPSPEIDGMFRMSKIRASESIFNTKGGYMHAPGGESYYAAIWANDQAEYVNAFFPYLGYWKGNESALNSFRHFARFMNDEYKPIPSSIIAEGTDIWNGAGDRGDAAMIAYGASRFALEMADDSVTDELMPLIRWCLEYCRRHLNRSGVVSSDTDELEGRFPTGDANLCTSSLYYDALVSASYLCKGTAEGGRYARRAESLRKAIEKYFGADMKGFRTYRYYDGNDLLRSWICIPLTCGILDRSEGTLEALFSPYLWTKDGCLTQEGSETFWDRSTLYALRGAFCAHESDLAKEKLEYYSRTRLLGDHVPYAIEAWPEGSQRHLSAESGLYARVITEGLFGIRPTGGKTFTVSPSLPSDWDHMSLEHIKLFGSDISLFVSRTEEGGIEVLASIDGVIRKYSCKDGESVTVSVGTKPQTFTLSSPDSKNTVTLCCGENLTYSVSHDGKTVIIPSTISMDIKGLGILGKNPSVVGVQRLSKDETVDSPFHRQKTVTDRYNEVAVTFEGDWTLRMRCYNEGVAYRIETDLATFGDEVIVNMETAQFLFEGDPKAWVNYSRGDDPYANAYQNVYTYEKASEMGSFSPVASLPLAVETVSGLTAMIGESDLRSYPGMFLKAEKGGYAGDFGRLPDSLYVHTGRYQQKVVSRHPYISRTSSVRTYPWRFVEIAEDDTALPVSNLAYLLGEPSRVQDISWIRPGQCAWEWWNDWGLQGVGFKPGINTETYKYYIDFASKNNIPYLIMDEGWSERGDLMTVKPDVDLDAILDYAREKGVGIWLWAVGYLIDSQSDVVYDHYAAKGVRGFKVDFFDRDDQYAVEMIYRIASDAARRGLMIDLHGMYKPTGLNRTFPNIVNFEGVYGMEELKWSDPDMPLYDVTFPYLRMAQGPVDYTSGAFLNESREEFKIDYRRPRSQGTRAHQVATYVVFDAPFPMLCDSPTNYETDLECLAYITSIPTDVDETRILQGRIGEYIVTARRKGDVWYVGALTNWDARQVELPLDFLGDGLYSGELLTDLSEGPSSGYNIENITVSTTDTLRLNLSSGGGAALILKPLGE